MTADGLFLVCGAAGGTQGSTGAHVVSILQNRGVQVRALVHRDDERAKALRERGVQVTVGDLLDPAAMTHAMEGVRRAYFAYPVRVGFVEAARNFALAASRARLDTVVAISHLNAGSDALSPHTRRHGEVETLFDQADIGVIHLRAAVFFENILRQTVWGISQDNLMRMPLGSADTKLPLIAGEDVARLAAGLLLNPEPYRGNPVFAIGEVLRACEIAEAFTAVLERPIQYDAVSDAAWRAEAIDREGEDSRVQIEHLSAVWATMRVVSEKMPDRFQPTPEIFEKLCGKSAQSFRDFLQTRIQDFSSVNINSRP